MGLIENGARVARTEINKLMIFKPGIPEFSDHRPGFVVQLIAELSKPGETRFVVFRGPELVYEGDWRPRSAGSVSFVWEAFYDGRPAPIGPYRLVFYTRDDNGATVQVSTAWIGR